MAKYHEIPEVDEMVQEYLKTHTSKLPKAMAEAMAIRICESKYEEETGFLVPRYPYMPRSAAAKGARYSIQATTGLIRLYESGRRETEDDSEE